MRGGAERAFHVLPGGATADVVHYSRGRKIEDNRPTQRVAANMDAFIDQLEGDRSASKAGAAYFCGPLNGDGKRCAAGALPRRWVAVDLDRIEAAALADVLVFFERFYGAAWPTHSSTPTAPRLRVIIELERPASRDQCIAIGKTLEAELCGEFGDNVTFDSCTFRPEQPVLVPPAGVVIQRLNGAPLSVPNLATPTTATPAPTEEVQKTSEVMLFSSVALPFSSVGGSHWVIPPDSIPAEVGQRNACLFRLARHVKASLPYAAYAELRTIALKWHELARPVIGTTDFSVTLNDFLRGIERVQQPFGTIMHEVLASIDGNTSLPDGVAALGYGKPGNRLVRICAALQAREGDGPIFLSARQAGELVGVHFTDASRMLATFVRDGILELVRRGSGKMASRYRYVWLQVVAEPSPPPPASSLDGSSAQGAGSNLTLRAQ